MFRASTSARLAKRHATLPGLRRQHGVAIILAILVTALATMLATNLVLRVQQWIDRLSLSQNYQQAYELARSGFDYGLAILQDDASHSVADHLGENWARRLPPFEGEGGIISGYIVDMQGKFNVNNLLLRGKINADALTVYKKILENAKLPPELAETLADYLDADNEPRSGGAESSYYQTLTPAYTPANGPLYRFSNLARVKGYDRTVMAKLEPLVTVFPVDSSPVVPTATGSSVSAELEKSLDQAALQAQPRVNVNTAPAEVLAAAVEGLSLAEGQSLVQGRKDAYFTNITDFYSRLPQKEVKLLIQLGVSSNYFEVHSAAKFQETAVRIKGTVFRQLQENRGWSKILYLNIE